MKLQQLHSALFQKLPIIELVDEKQQVNFLPKVFPYLQENISKIREFQAVLSPYFRNLQPKSYRVHKTFRQYDMHSSMTFMFQLARKIVAFNPDFYSKSLQMTQYLPAIAAICSIVSGLESLETRVFVGLRQVVCEMQSFGISSQRLNNLQVLLIGCENLRSPELLTAFSEFLNVVANVRNEKKQLVNFAKRAKRQEKQLLACVLEGLFGSS